MGNELLTPVRLPADSDDDVAHYRFSNQGRLVLDTMHGQVIIDIRKDDVNAYTLTGSRRDDHLLIRPAVGK